MDRNLVITMSGGTTTVINATLVGIIRAARESNEIEKIFAGYPGISGLINEELIDLSAIKEEELKKLYFTPASGFIGTTRVKRLDMEEMERLEKVFRAYGIRYYFNIGGNGTIKQTKQISEGISEDIIVAALPKTVDNDLGDNEFRDVYFTPGYPSCANYWKHKVSIFNLENLGAFSHDQVLVAQTFGRNTGFLAATARLADPDRRLPLIILLPEDKQPFDVLLDEVHNMIQLHGRALIVMSEGYQYSELGERYDPSGQIMYSSSKTTSAQILVNLLMENNVQARHFIPGFDQRSDITFTLLSDLAAAHEVGGRAVDCISSGKRDFFATISFNPETGGSCYSSIPLEDIHDYSRVLPAKWIVNGGFDVTDDFIGYLSPLVLNQEIVGVPGNYKDFMMPLSTITKKMNL